MEVLTYVYKPVFVKVVPVTEDNLADVAKWCGGEIISAPRFKDGPEMRCVKVEVFRPVSPRQTHAFPGDRVIQLPKGAGWKVYTKKAFSESFDLVANSTAGLATPPVVVNASA